MDRSEIYAAMADEEDDATDTVIASRPLISGGITNLKGKSVSITVEGKAVDVATAAYVGRLEEVVMQQKMILEKQGRLLRALEQLLRQQKGGQAQHAAVINDLRRELEQKIDRRD